MATTFLIPRNYSGSNANKLTLSGSDLVVFGGTDGVYYPTSYYVSNDIILRTSNIALSDGRGFDASVNIDWDVSSTLSATHSRYYADNNRLPLIGGSPSANFFAGPGGGYSDYLSFTVNSMTLPAGCVFQSWGSITFARGPRLNQISTGQINGLYGELNYSTAKEYWYYGFSVHNDDCGLAISLNYTQPPSTYVFAAYLSGYAAAFDGWFCYRAEISSPTLNITPKSRTYSYYTKSGAGGVDHVSGTVTVT